MYWSSIYERFCVCMCEYMCMFASVSVCVLVYVNACVCAYLCVYVWVCICLCVSMCAGVYACLLCECESVHVCETVCTWACRCVYVARDWTYGLYVTGKFPIIYQHSYPLWIIFNNYCYYFSWVCLDIGMSHEFRCCKNCMCWAIFPIF